MDVLCVNNGKNKIIATRNVANIWFTATTKPLCFLTTYQITYMFLWMRSCASISFCNGGKKKWWKKFLPFVADWSQIARKLCWIRRRMKCEGIYALPLKCWAHDFVASTQNNTDKWTIPSLYPFSTFSFACFAIFSHLRVTRSTHILSTKHKHNATIYIEYAQSTYKTKFSLRQGFYLYNKQNDALVRQANMRHQCIRTQIHNNTVWPLKMHRRVVEGYSLITAHVVRSLDVVTIWRNSIL